MNTDMKRGSRKNEPGPDEYVENGLLMCAVCRKPRQKETTSGKVTIKHRTPCDCQQKKLQEEEERERQAEAWRRKRMFQRTMQGLQERYHLSDQHYDEFRFKKDRSPDIETSRMCRDYVEKWEEVEKGNLGILFYGTTGAGKSFYAGSIANELLEREVSVAITNVPRILNILQGERERQKVLDHLQDYRLLVLDDLGAERESSYAAEQLYQIVDVRSRAGMPLIITTNVTMKELKNPKSMQLKRIYDRILALCPIRIRMIGEDHRIEHSIEALKLAKELFQKNEAQS